MISGIDPHQIGGINELMLKVLQAEMVAVSIIVHLFALFRIGTKVLADAVVGARRDWWEVRHSLRALARKKSEEDGNEKASRESRDA